MVESSLAWEGEAGGSKAGFGGRGRNEGILTVDFARGVCSGSSPGAEVP